MSKPKVTLENRAAVYEWYAGYRPNQRAALLGHRLMSAAFPLRIDFAEGAEIEIERLLKEKRQLVVAPKHLKFNDQFVVAAMAEQAAVLHPLRGHTHIASKASLYGVPLLRPGLDVMGAIPAFRQKDVAKGAVLTSEQKEAQKEAGRMLIATSIHRLNSGPDQHMAIFTEGTRDPTKDEHTVGDLKRGIGEIACGVDADVRLALIPVGISYQASDRSPNVFIGRPFTEPFSQPEAVLETLKPQLQEAQTFADTAADYRQRHIQN